MSYQLAAQALSDHNVPQQIDKNNIESKTKFLLFPKKKSRSFRKKLMEISETDTKGNFQGEPCGIPTICTRLRKASKSLPL